MLDHVALEDEHVLIFGYQLRRVPSPYLLDEHVSIIESMNNCSPFNHLNLLKCDAYIDRSIFVKPINQPRRKNFGATQLLSSKRFLGFQSTAKPGEYCALNHRLDSTFSSHKRR